MTLSPDPVGLTKTDAAYARVHAAILAGSYPPGHRFIMGRLADELGISTVPMREAMRKLEAAGLVEYLPHIGAVVMTTSSTTWRETVEVSATLEAAATAQAAPLITSETLEEARDINARIRRVAHCPDGDLHLLNHIFHDCLIRACPNARLKMLTQREADRLVVCQRQWQDASASSVARMAIQHEQLLDAVEALCPPSRIADLVLRHRRQPLALMTPMTS